MSKTDDRDSSKKFIDHFAYLANTPRAKTLLKKIGSKVTAIKETNGKLVTSFHNNTTLTATKPAKTGKYKKWPKSFQNIVSRHELVYFPDDQGIFLGDYGNFDPSYLKDVNSKILKHVKSASEVLCPITDYPDWWLYHPVKKFGNEPALCFFSHEGGDVDKPLNISLSELFLKRVSEKLDNSVVIPAPTLTDKEWWNSLSKKWQNTLKETTGVIEKDDPMDPTNIRRCITLHYVYNIPDNNLEPIRNMPLLRLVSFATGVKLSPDDLKKFKKEYPKIKIIK
jgi:hypothetical protein